ncbi:MAG: hypothetical protein K0R75_1686 [Paenibacillaceae bacterium]|jgi:hypothetical protein|nr:hypothetical protein [Paenibacillaceae bacterium]
MKRETLFLKIVLILMVVPVLAACIFGLPVIAKGAAENYPLWVYLPIIGVMYVNAIPYFVALYQAFRLLSNIDKNRAFSELSVGALRTIKLCAIMISILFLAVLPLFYVWGDRDDAPGLVVLGMVLTFAPMVIAVFAAVLQKLLKHAIDIKSENDLTV